MDTIWFYFKTDSDVSAPYKKEPPGTYIHACTLTSLSFLSFTYSYFSLFSLYVIWSWLLNISLQGLYIYIYIYISMFVSSNGNACMDILHIYGALIINYLAIFWVDDGVFVPI
jgi:hypothetical protein